MQRMRQTADAPRRESDSVLSFPDEYRYLNVTQTATLLGVSRVTIWRWIRDGRLSAARFGHRTVRIARSDVEHLSARLSPTGAGSNPSSFTGQAHLVHRREGAAETHQHRVQFYECDAALVDEVGRFFIATLTNGGAAILVATPDHQTDIVTHLLAAGIDPDALQRAGRLVCLDARDTLDRILHDGAPDAGRFQATIAPLIERAAAGSRPVAVFGEMVALLAAAGNRRAAIDLEELWNGLQRTHAFTLLCAYPLQANSAAHVAFAQAVNATHTHVIPAESYTALTNDQERLRAIALLQHQAYALEAEVIERRRAEHLRNEFLAVAAHELKTPLTTLSGHTQLLLRQIAHGQPPPAERMQRGLKTVAGQAERLGRLVNQLLDISRLEAGKLSLDRRPVDVAALLTRIVGDTQPRTDRHQFVLHAPAALDMRLDPLRIEQVLSNLLDNAIRYSPAGGDITIELRRQDGVIELSVRDRGLGIPPSLRERLFDQFYQAHGDGYRSGLGLGLFISRQIVELHGGTLRAEFPEDGGTCMIICLPAN